MTAHRLPASDLHTVWDATLPPALRVESGDVVEFVTVDASGGGVARQVAAGTLACPEALRAEVLASACPAVTPTGGVAGHPLTGPVFIEDARPGDTLEVELLDVRTAAWGWNACRPGGIGLLDDRVPGPYTHFWDLRDGAFTDFLDVARVPLAPFPGVIGVAPAAPGPHRTAPPRQVGGNLDVRQLTAGARLFLPVEVPGALLSVGDVHAAQGDGEVCSTGIETDGVVTARVHLHRADTGRRLRTPELQATPEPTGLWRKGAYVTTGNEPTLLDAARTALGALLEHLEHEYALSFVQAYVLASACVDLRISQLVDAPHFTVSAHLPLSIFDR